MAGVGTGSKVKREPVYVAQQDVKSINLASRMFLWSTREPFSPAYLVDEYSVL